MNDPYNRDHATATFRVEQCSDEQVRLARRAAARNATDADELTQLLDMLGIGRELQVTTTSDGRP